MFERMLIALLPVAAVFGAWGCAQDAPKKAEPPPQKRMLVTGKHKLGSQMPWRYAAFLDPESPSCILKKEDLMPRGFMTWSLYGGTLDPKKPTENNAVILTAMNPKHIKPMMYGLDDLDPELVKKLSERANGVLLGKDRLSRFGLRIGDCFRAYGLAVHGLDLDFEVVGVLPEGRYNEAGIMNERYLQAWFESQQKKTGKAHPHAERSLTMIWLQVRDQAAFDRIAEQIEKAPQFKDLPLKCQTEEDAERDGLKMKR